MAINLSDEITKIKIKMGIYGINMPIDNPDNLIMEVIRISTLPTFSVYHPYYDHLHTSLNDLQRDTTYDNPERNGIGYIMPEFSNRKLLNVSDVQYSESSGYGMSRFNSYDFGGLLYSSSHMMYKAMLANSANNLQSTIMPKLTFNFIEPCHLIIYDAISSNNMDIELAFVHHESLSTIPATAEPSFFKLALYDVEDAFYQIVKHWDNLETVYGNIQLKIDEWADAANKREQLLEEWDNNYHLDIPKSLIYK